MFQSCLLNKQKTNRIYAANWRLCSGLYFWAGCATVIICYFSEVHQPYLSVSKGTVKEPAFPIFVFTSWFLRSLPDFPPVSRFFPLCIPILWQFLMLSETQGPRCTPLCCLVATREHDYATRPSYFEVINHKVNNQSSGTATGGPPWQRKICQKLEKGRK